MHNIKCGGLSVLIYVLYFVVSVMFLFYITCETSLV